MQEIRIHRLGPPDLDTLVSTPDGLFDNPVDPLQAKRFLDDPNHEILMAYDGDLAVGMASASVLLHPDKAPVMFINEVGTRDAYLRRGIATALCTRLIDLARESGCKGIWLATETDNVAARGLYQSLDADEMTGVIYGWDDVLDD